MASEVKIRSGDLVKLEVELKKKLEQSINNKSLLSEVGQYLVKNIRGEASLGKGYSNKRSKEGFEGDDPQKLAPLKKSTIKRREELGKINQNGTLFNPKKSNLTLTGKTLNSISFIVSKVKPLLSIVSDGDHPGYVQKNGKRTKSVPFRDIIKWQSEKGRNIFGISSRMYGTVVKMIKSHLRRSLK